MNKYEFYFCSDTLGENKKDWQQKMIIEADNNIEAIRKFKNILNIKTMSDPKLDYVDYKIISEV